LHRSKAKLLLLRYTASNIPNFIEAAICGKIDHRLKKKQMLASLSLTSPPHPKKMRFCLQLYFTIG
jgi:hypothetical protein